MKKKLVFAAIIGATFGLNAQKTFDQSYMDKSVAPSKDFYQFANGEWVKNNPVPKTESRWGSFNELEKDNYIKLEKILADLAVDSKDDSGKKLSDFYQSYVSEKRKDRNYVGVQTMNEVLRQLNFASVNSPDFAKVIAKLHLMGINAFFSFDIEQDLKNNAINVAYFSQPSLGLPNKTYYEEKKFQQYDSAYKAYIQNLFDARKGRLNGPAGKNIGKPMADDDTTKQGGLKPTRSVIKVEKFLAEGMFSPVEMRDISKNYNPIKLNQLGETLDFKWAVYFKELGIDLSDAPFVVISQLTYFEMLNKYFSVANANEVRDYLQFLVLKSLAPYANKDFDDVQFDFYQKYLLGKELRSPQSHEAIDVITRLPIGDAMGKYFVDYYFKADASKKINEMVDNISAVFKERIEKLTWMSAETKKQALVKLSSFGRKLGHPTKWKDFSSVDLNADNLTHNIIELRKYAVKEMLGKYGKPIDKDDWGMPAHMINAYYNPLLNEIAFPAGIMQAPFFDVEFEDAVNYARIGMVIGHEFTHGFDDMGAQFAADGSFTNWWNKDDMDKFNDLTKTFGETYGHFCPIEDHCVNPDLTMGENIADLGGLTLAYYAYTKTDEFKKNQKIGGFTPAQRFFISFAQIWKINYTEGELKNRIANDPHSPGMYRVNGPLKNCPEFFEAFGVKNGQPMRNPKNKMITIW